RAPPHRRVPRRGRHEGTSSATRGSVVTRPAFAHSRSRTRRLGLIDVADPSTYRPAPGTIPESPGVYRFRDPHGRVIYVGKAKCLRSRLHSSSGDLWGLHPRTQRMVTTAASVDWLTVGAEVEAHHREYNWIKAYGPRFNVRYRDDKS